MAKRPDEQKTAKVFTLEITEDEVKMVTDVLRRTVAQDKTSAIVKNRLEAKLLPLLPDDEPPKPPAPKA